MIDPTHPLAPIVYGTPEYKALYRKVIGPLCAHCRTPLPSSRARFCSAECHEAYAADMGQRCGHIRYDREEAVA